MLNYYYYYLKILRSDYFIKQNFINFLNLKLKGIESFFKFNNIKDEFYLNILKVSFIFKILLQINPKNKIFLRKFKISFFFIQTTLNFICSINFKKYDFFNLLYFFYSNFLNKMPLSDFTIYNNNLFFYLKNILDFYF
jgi:hypothetical protein